MNTTLTLSPQPRAKLKAWACSAYPLETCGVLIGERTNDGVCRVERAYLGYNLNVSRARDRYELDPGSFVEADAQARALGLDIVGIWHTHPDHPARPSETDRIAAWEGWSYLIISVGPEGVDELRSWRLNNQRFEEEKVTT